MLIFPFSFQGNLKTLPKCLVPSVLTITDSNLNVITLTPGTWKKPETFISLNYEWYVNGDVIENSGLTYGANFGDNVQVKETAINNNGVTVSESNVIVISGTYDALSDAGGTYILSGELISKTVASYTPDSAGITWEVTGSYT